MCVMRVWEGGGLRVGCKDQGQGQKVGRKERWPPNRVDDLDVFCTGAFV